MLGHISWHSRAASSWVAGNCGAINIVADTFAAATKSSWVVTHSCGENLTACLCLYSRHRRQNQYGGWVMSSSIKIQMVYKYCMYIQACVLLDAQSILWLMNISVPFQVLLERSNLSLCIIHVGGGPSDWYLYAEKSYLHRPKHWKCLDKNSMWLWRLLSSILCCIVDTSVWLPLQICNS